MATGSTAGSKPKVTQAENSIRLDMMKLNTLLDDLDRKDAASSSTKRQFVRWPFRHACVPLTVTHVGGSQATIRVACRNISCGGISVLHSAYMHTGSKCSVSLPHSSGVNADLPGTITRCSHLSGVIHEIGIKFKDSIRVTDYVASAPFSGNFSLENVDPNELRGTVLYVADSVLDQRLVKHFLRETQLRVQLAAKMEEAIDKAKARVDLILCDYMLDSRPTTGVIEEIRKAGVVTPIIVITADTSPLTRRTFATAQADAFISKPISQSVLFRAIAEFMMVDDGKGLTSTSLPAGHPSLVLVESFVSEIQQHAKMLADAIARESVEECRALCLQIAGVAPVVGFAKLAGLAKSAETAVSASMSVNESMAALSRLVAMCSNIRQR